MVRKLTQQLIRSRGDPKPPTRCLRSRTTVTSLDAKLSPKNMRGELAQARPVTLSVAATAAGTRIKSAWCETEVFQHIAHLTLAISLVWVAHMISHEYVEHESGRKGADRRKQFAALFDDAAKRKFDCVLFWALDRFSREGMAQTIAHLQCLVSYGVAFHSYTEPHLATDNELVRKILPHCSRHWRNWRRRRSVSVRRPVWPAQRPTASRSGVRSSGLKFAKRSRSEQRRARHHMPSPRRSRLIGILPPSTRN